MPQLTERIKGFYGSNALDWFSLTYLVDWTVAFGFWLTGEVIGRLEVWKQDFSVDDGLISHPHTKQQIKGSTNNLIALAAPLIVIIVCSIRSHSFVTFHHGALGLWVSRSLSHLLTESLKNRVGRLRPDFLARCSWNEILNQCTGNPEDVQDGRRSFPSGHSSTIFSGMAFLFLFLAAQTAAWSFSIPLSGPRPWPIQSRLGRIAITLFPLTIATWVAISRVEDYRHHKEDVIVGSLIGIFSSFVGYMSYWRNPFPSQFHSRGLAHLPRYLYKEDTVDNQNFQHIEGIDNYELSRLEEGIE